MIRRTLFLAICSAAATCHAPASHAQWRVVLANNDATELVLPSLLPGSGSFTLNRASIDDATGALGFARSPTSAPASLWAERNGTLAPYAELLATGAAGPGRSGGEAGHVFRTFWYKQDGSFGANRVFAARAGEPTQPADAATFGIWLWNGQRNTEIARLNTAGALGPGLDAGTQYTSFGSTGSTGFPNAQALPTGGAVLDATVTGSNKAIVLYRPGQAARPCLLENSTDPALSPGVADNAFFYDSGGSTAIIDVPIVGHDGRIMLQSAYRITGSGTSHRGIFQICAGSPQAFALTTQTGAMGPGMSDPTATFSEFGRVRPTLSGELFFWARGSAGGSNFIGGFHHAGGSNQPLWLNGTEGPLGPGYSGYTFDQTSAPSLYAAGRHAVLNTTIRSVAGSTSVRGLWRMQPGQSPQPVAIVGDTGAYAPATGRAWRSFSTATVLDTGDIITVAEVSNPTAVGVWRLRPGAAPQQVLAIGDTVQVPTSAGLVPRTVTSISNTYFDELAPGLDGWASQQGDVLVRANVQGVPASATVFVRGAAARSDRLFDFAFD